MLRDEGTETEWIHYCSLKRLPTTEGTVKGTEDEQIP